MDGYVRVSRVMGREGDSFVSPDEQRRKIKEWAKLRGVKIAKWHEDLDVSGAKTSRPGLDAMLARIESGATDGVVVAKLDRLSRLGIQDALKLVEKIHGYGGSIAAIDLGIDPTTPTGKLLLTFMLGLAEWERERLTDEWEAVRRRAHSDGVHLAPVPVGYLREDGSRSKLVSDPATAPLIREAFRRRARGESLQPLTEFLQESGIAISKSGVRGLLQNRTYLGEASGARKGERLAGAHEPLITVDEFEAVQVRKGSAPIRNGTVAAQGMLTRIIRCAGCGKAISVGGGATSARYFCRGHSAAGPCSAPAAAMVRLVDDFVREAITTALVDGTLKATADAIRRYNRARDAVTKAQSDFDALADAKLLAQFGPKRLAVMAEQQRAVLGAAKQALAEIPRPETAVEPDSLLWDKWSIDEERAFARQVISEVRLRRGGKGRYGPPIHERVAIRWAGHDDFDTTVYERGAEARETAKRLTAA
jgi:site-specific DNA recombinase